MYKKISAVLLLLILSVGFRNGGSGSKEVEITLGDGTKFDAEILSVRDSAIVVTRNVGASEQDMLADPGSVVALPFSQVATVGTAGSSYTAVGLFSGMAIGCLGGCAVGSSQNVEQEKNDTFGCNAASEKTSKMLGGAAIGGLAGGVVGAAIGGAASSSGQSLVTVTNRDFQVLKNVARYPLVEPAYLKSLAR